MFESAISSRISEITAYMDYGGPRTVADPAWSSSPTSLEYLKKRKDNILRCLAAGGKYADMFSSNDAPSKKKVFELLPEQRAESK